ncbi:pyocin knob domain-containing protein, partial [Avibacterium paragallinarum]
MKDLLPKIDSQDGEFHNGDPASGTQGTRVTAEWLNNVQAHLRDVGEEVKYLLLQAGLTPIPSKTTQIYEAIMAVINANRRNGNTTQKGEIQLTDSINMASSVFGASALAVKTAFDKAESAYNLAESKQSPATTLAGYKIADFAQRALTASDNLNNITVKGIYHNSTYRNTPNNNYPEEQSGVLLVLSAEEQIYFASNGKMFKRLKSNNNWANGWARVDGNAIFEEGGMIKKTLVLNETLVMKRLFAGNQAREWANYHSQQGHTFYLSEDRSKKGMSLTQEGLEVVGTLKGEDFNLGNGHSLKTLFTQIGSFSLIADLGEMNINELKFPCIAGQPRNDNARCDRGYPVEARAGSLSVMPSAYGYKQVYNTYDYGLIFTRNQTANGEW